MQVERASASIALPLVTSRRSWARRVPAAANAAGVASANAQGQVTTSTESVTTNALSGAVMYQNVPTTAAMIKMAKTI